MGGWVMVPFYQVSGKEVIQNIKMEQDFEAHTSFITDEEYETDKKKVILREISDLLKVVCDKWSFC